MNQELLEQIAKERINNIRNIQIEYDREHIIIVDTFINELYDYIYNANGGNHDKIIELVTTNKIQPYYDNKLMYFKIKLINILNDNNYNLSVLCDELKIRYSWIINQMLGELKSIKKEGNILVS